MVFHPQLMTCRQPVLKPKAHKKILCSNFEDFDIIVLDTICRNKFGTHSFWTCNVQFVSICSKYEAKLSNILAYTQTTRKRSNVQKCELARDYLRLHITYNIY